MRLRFGAILAACGLLVACAGEPLPPPKPTLANIQAVRAGGIAPLRVGEFVPGPGEPTAMDKRVVVRAGAMAAPGGSFAKYLGEMLGAELEGGGKLDPNSKLVVSGVLTRTQLSSAMPVGSAEVEARIVLQKNGAAAFDKTLRASATWKSEFIGAVAIPDAFNHYDGLFREIVAKLLTDPQFRAAAAP